MEKFYKYILSVFIVFSVITVNAQNNQKTLGTDYYTRIAGAYNNNTNVWSLTGYAGAPCGCAPPCNLPANSAVHINKLIIATCNPLDIGSNATFDLAAGGTFSLTGPATITGTGSLSIAAGSTLAVQGNVTFSGSGDATINGKIIVTGTTTFPNTGGSTICGSGSLTTGTLVLGNPMPPCGSGIVITVLPIELLNFTVEQKGNSALILWQTATEKNNDYFDLERSTDGINFELVKRINSKGDNAGNSSYVLDYLFTDEKPLEGVSYYRLKQVDTDGKFEIFKMVSFNQIKDTYEKIEFKIYPNPNDGNFLIDVGGIENNHTVEVKIVDILGKIIFQETTDVQAIKNKEFAINLKNKFPAGNYTSVFSLEDIRYHSVFIINQ